jgi:hypothetical protein
VPCRPQIPKERERLGVLRGDKRAVAMRKLDRLKRVEKGEPGWQRTAWAMERLYPKEFSRPEVQLQYKAAEDTKQTGDSAQVLDWLAGETATIKELVHGSVET